MSRNLANGGCCGRCRSDLAAKGEPRLLTEEDAGVYYKEYAGLVVAEAECSECHAKYLGWLDGRTTKHRFPLPKAGEEGKILDCSYRSTFNDEPGLKDLPPYKEVHRHFGFPTALALCKNGQKIARIDWEGRDVFIRFHQGFCWVDEKPLKPFLAAHGEFSGSFEVWTPTQSDMLSDDWFVVK